mmetsp:Transcript_4048/g.3383  ORF Transcript_4048/g.3383 Transcript_4048/m.3383 type:complete len:86 (+) Transcript_4048:1153-1410(+)
MLPKKNCRKVFSVNYFGSRIHDKVKEFQKKHKLDFDFLKNNSEEREINCSSTIGNHSTKIKAVERKEISIPKVMMGGGQLFTNQN